jgi:UDP-glucose 4-epimerase
MVSRIALIGGTGFIGRHLLERLRTGSPGSVRVLVHGSEPEWLSAMPQAVPVRGDVLKPESLAPLLEGAEMIINLVGQVSRDVDNYQHANLGGMVALGQACLRYGIRRLIHASSALVYGDALDATEDFPCRPISPYATMKLAAEEILAGLLGSEGRLLCLRLSNVYGQRQSKGLLPYLVNRIRSRQPITIDADGAQVRDFVHVHDVAEAFMRALAVTEGDGVVNIGSGRPTSIIRLVRVLEDILEVPATGQYCPEHTGGERRNTVNVSRAEQMLGWRSGIEVTEGIRTVLAGQDKEWEDAYA